MVPSVPTDGTDSSSFATRTSRVHREGAENLKTDIDGLALVDIVIRDGKIAAVVPAGGGLSSGGPRANFSRLTSTVGCAGRHSSVIHTHIDKGHTCGEAATTLAH